MPPRKGRRSTADAVTNASVQAESSTSAAANSAALSASLSTVQATVDSACADWTSRGQDAVKGLIRGQVQAVIQHQLPPSSDDSAASLPEIILSKTLAILLARSTILSVSVEQVADLYRAVIDELEGDAKIEVTVTLGEVLAELVEMLEDERKDLEELAKTPTVVEGQTGKDDMEVDANGGARAVSAGERGMELIKLLLESEHLPSYIPSLLLTPDRLLPLNIHPMAHDLANFKRQIGRRSTALFYKQSKYNLLRESSEGFSRLIVLLLGSEALPPAAVAQQESEEARLARAQGVWGKIMGLIGYFSLSPPRVLDLILDIASFHVAEHWQFWLELLKCSPWGSTARSNKGKERMWDESVQGVEAALRGDGDRVLSQVLGVKFGFYQKPDGGDTPLGLVYMTALLLKHGFIAFADILPFMSPDDTALENIRKEYSTSLGTSSGPGNALTNAVLVDEDAPAASTTEEEQKAASTKPPPEQRIRLLQALLAVGHMPPALYLLGQAPWLAQYSPAIADFIMRIVEYSVEPLYRATQQEWAAAAQGEGLEEGEVDLLLEEPASHFRPKVKTEDRRIAKSLWAPTPEDSITTQYQFFYPDWARGLARWEKPEDVRQHGLKWLGLIRGLGGRRVEFLVKICRIGQVHFARLRQEKEERLGRKAITRADCRLVEPSEAEMQPWLEIIRISLLPSLSASTVTAAFDVEIWKLLRHFPYTTRYSLYGEWRDSTTLTRTAMGKNPCPIAAAAASEATRSVKKALARVTAVSSVPVAGGKAPPPDRGPARALAKLSHSNPCALWATAVIQVKNYGNIGQFIIEAGRYMTQLSYDVATFTLLDTLSNDSANRLNPNGTGVADWLQYLATFAGDFNRRYAAMDLEPLLQFIMNRLMRCESADLAILESLISIMSGESRVDNDAISADQLQSLAGGRQLIKEVFDLTQIMIVKPQAAPIADRSKLYRKSLPRLINGLRETGMAMPIWIGLGQTSQGSADKSADTPIKAMSNTQDSCHDLFVQYGELLRRNFSDEEHIAHTPDLYELVEEFGLDFAQAFQVLRPRLKAEMQKQIKAVKQPAEPVNGSGDTGMQVDEASPGNDASDAVWSPALQTVIEQAQELLPGHDSSGMGAPFFVTFWLLTLPDISCSTEAYKRMTDRITGLVKSVNTNYQPVSEAGRKAEAERLYTRRDVLEKEKQSLEKAVEETKQRLMRESKHWFSAKITEMSWRTRMCQQLHQHCFYPRAIQTPADAIFVPRLIRFMHDIATPHFTSLFAYGNFFAPGLAASIFACTESEARNLGRCLAAIMADLDRWHADEKVFRREALGDGRGKANTSANQANGDAEMVGDKAPSADSATGEETTTPDCLPGMMITPRGSPVQRPMSWVQFRGYYAQKFHHTLRDALVSCWKETEFMHIKNAITVGLQIMPSFPMMMDHGKEVQDAVKSIIAKQGEGSITQDVVLQCHGYLNQLTIRQKEKPFVDPPKFYANGRSVLTPPTPKVTKPEVNGTKPEPKAEPKAKEEPKQPAEASKTNGSAPASSDEDPTLASNGASSRNLQAELRAKLELQRNAKAGASRDGASAGEGSSSDLARSNSNTSATATGKSDVATPPAGPRGPRASVSEGPTSKEIKEPPAGPSKKEAPTGPSGRSNMGPPAVEKPLSEAEQRAAEDARRFAALQESALASASSGTSISGSNVSKADVSAPIKAPTAPKASSTSAQPDTKPDVSTNTAAKPAASSRRSSPDRTRETNRRRSRSVDSRVSERSKRDRRDERPRDRERDRDRDRERERDRDKDREREKDRDRSRRETDRERERIRDRKISQTQLAADAGRRENGRSRTPSVRGDDDRHERRKGEELITTDKDDRRRSLRADSGDRRESRDERDKDRRSGDRDKEREQEREPDRDDRRRRNDGGGSRDSARRGEDEVPRDARDRRNDRDRERPRERDDRDRNRNDRRDEPLRDGRDDRARDPATRGGRDDARSDDRRDHDVRDDSGRRTPGGAVVTAKVRQRDPPPHAAPESRGNKPRSPVRADNGPARESTPLADRISGSNARAAADNERPATDNTPARPHGLPLRPNPSPGPRQMDRDRAAGRDEERRNPLAPVVDRSGTSSNARPASTPAGGPSLAERLGMSRTNSEIRDRADDRGGRGGRDGNGRGNDARRDGRDERVTSATDRSRRSASPAHRARSDRRDEPPSGGDRDRRRESDRDRDRGESRRDEEERDRERKRPHDGTTDTVRSSREGSPSGTKRIRIDRGRARREPGGDRLLASALKSANNGGK